MFSAESRNYYKKLILLAVPVSLGQVGHMMTGMADTAMVGQLGKTELAGVAFATNVFMFLFIFGIGLSLGITTLVGQAFGSNNLTKCRSLLQQGLFFYVLVGALLTLLNLALIPLMPYMGQEADVVQVASPFYYYIAFSVLPVMAFSGLKQFLEGMGKTVPPMVVSLLGNLLNVALNYVFIFGAFGIEPMGVNGAGLATLLARISMFVGLALYMYWHTELRFYFQGFAKFKADWAVLTDLGKVGIPIGLQFFMEVATFALGAIMMGWLGKVPQSAHQIAITLAATTFLAASGIGTAATIVLSNLKGQHQYGQLRKAGYAAFRLVLVFMGFTAIGFAVFRDALPTYFINENDMEVAAIASGLLVIAALFQLSDGLQMVGISCLRGLGDVEVPMWMALVCYWVIALPSSYIFAFVLDLGPPGIWYGYLTGLTLAGVAFLVRFNLLTKRMQKEI
jgi:multidrug resistance protein, MATE family